MRACVAAFAAAAAAAAASTKKTRSILCRIAAQMGGRVRCGAGRLAAAMQASERMGRYRLNSPNWSKDGLIIISTINSEIALEISKSLKGTTQKQNNEWRRRPI